MFIIRSNGACIKNCFVAFVSVSGDPSIVAEKSFFDSMSGFITIIAGGILALIVFIAIAVAVAMIRSRRSKAGGLLTYNHFTLSFLTFRM